MTPCLLHLAAGSALQASWCHQASRTHSKSEYSEACIGCWSVPMMGAATVGDAYAYAYHA
jgi:hypothetical protein